MKELLKLKTKEAVSSILPISIIILVLNCLLLLINKSQGGNLELLGIKEMIVFMFGAGFLIVGMSLFSLGADIAMAPIGEHIGSSLVKSRKLWLLIICALVLGILITLAEPDLNVLASQVPFDSSSLKWMIAIGVGIFLCLALFRNILQINLKKVLVVCYSLVAVLTLVLLITGKSAFLGVSFDSGGVTTGPVTVPFMMALGVGVSAISARKDKMDDGFGMVALCSIGPILAVLLLSLFHDGGALSYELSKGSLGSLSIYFTHMHEYIKEVGIALLPILVFFLIFNFAMLHLEKNRLIRILIGVGYSFVGLVLFLNAVNSGFLSAGRIIGMAISEGASWLLVPVGFLLGYVTVIAEPAIHSLNKQVEDVSGGAISRKSMLNALSIGVGCAIALALIRIVAGFSIIYYLIPGYLIALLLMKYVPDIYTSIAFDSGGVASGPMTAGFVLPFAIGACYVLNGAESIISGAFGVVSLVALTPLIAIQCLGLSVVLKQNVRRRIEERRHALANENEIINFDI